MFFIKNTHRHAIRTSAHMLKRFESFQRKNLTNEFGKEVPKLLLIWFIFFKIFFLIELH